MVPDKENTSRFLKKNRCEWKLLTPLKTFLMSHYYDI